MEKPQTTSEIRISNMNTNDLNPEHSYPCPVCWTKRAVYDTDARLYQPCLDCQKKGFIIHKSNSESR